MQRGHSDSRPSSPVAQPLILGTLFFVGAVAMAGMPPLSGFLGKVLLLRAAEETVALPWIWSVVLGSSLLIMVAWGRMGSSLFWNTLDTPVTGIPVHARLLLPAVALLAAGPLLMVLARPLTHFAAETAQQIFAPAAYIETVLANRSLVPATGTSP